MNTELPSLDPILNYIKQASGVLLAAIGVVASLVLIFYIIKIGARIAKASGDGNADEKSKAIKDLMWVILGFVLAVSASTIGGLLATVFITK